MFECASFIAGIPQMGISDATFYNWKKKYGGLGPSELRRLRQLEEEDAKLKKLVADLSLDKAMCMTCSQKSSEAFPQGVLSDDLRNRYRASLTQACALLKMSRSLYAYRSVARGSSTLITRIKEIAAARVHYGCRRVHVLLKRKAGKTISSVFIACINWTG